MLGAVICRYQGTFENGQRHGYGALYYATGSSYEGEWQQDQKHGNGVFTFEDGTVFDGMFENDRACTKEGQPWGPSGPGLKMRCRDLLDNFKEPEVLLYAGGSARADDAVYGTARCVC